ncbi:hypothetical protein [Geobacillus stearothermophilus]
MKTKRRFCYRSIIDDELKFIQVEAIDEASSAINRVLDEFMEAEEAGE